MSQKITKTFTSSLDQLHPLLIYISNVNGSEKMLKQLQLAVEEAFINIISYAYNKKPLPVIVEVSCDGKIVEITLIDEGPYFNLLEYPITESKKNGEGGAGIILIRNLIDEIIYHRIDDKNYLIFRKKIY